MRIGLLGDTHGQHRWTRFALWLFAQEGVDTVIQVGDFGIGKDGDRFHTEVDQWCRKFGIRLWVVPGNHENYDTIESLKENEDGTLFLTEHISVLPRGYRWEWQGRSFVALGGAPSVDRQWRLRDEKQFKGQKLWWIQEMITRDDADKTISGGYADVMIGHDAPFAPTIEARIAKSKNMFPLVDLMYASEGRELMEEVVSKVMPHYFFHGHYHFKVDNVRTWDTGDETRVMGLDCDGSLDAFAILDLDSFQAEHMSQTDVTIRIAEYNARPK